ncbi:PASTA domain-containing protein [Streptomyces sp. FXJ1.172]|uniref:PASTA domain-containing protein n=1 Tax=Streptomyces sp. FXJ1.172 TaxID=710705 RepID=UPI0007D00759|nr:PASTA domain-containing protein [Streptomyces sp. FXJ1.172]WEP00499.1 PASTA domain-containing protein [Streptomyces sp. FXJ1.172]
MTMPNLVGKNAENAEDAEDQPEKLGVPRSRIELQPDDGDHVVVLVASNWHVNAQSVKAGARLGVKQELVLGVDRLTWRERHHGHLLWSSSRLGVSCR